MDYKLSDLIEVEKSRSLLESFCEAVGIASAIIDLEGNVLNGVTEAMSPGNELFGLDRLQGLLKRKHDLKLDRLCTEIEMSLSEFQEGHQFDDITMLALKRII